MMESESRGTESRPAGGSNRVLCPPPPPPPPPPSLPPPACATGVITDELYRFDLATLVWSLVADARGTPPSPRYRHGWVAAGGRLYALWGLGLRPPTNREGAANSALRRPAGPGPRGAGLFEATWQAAGTGGPGSLVGGASQPDQGCPLLSDSRYLSGRARGVDSHRHKMGGNFNGWALTLIH